MSNKKYFWLKLKEDFFRDKKIKKLRKIAGGDTYTIIYLKLQLLSLKNNGFLHYEGVEDTFYEELALDIDEDEDNVKVTLMFLMKNGLIEESDEDKFAMVQTMELIGSETQAAARVRKHRERKQMELEMPETLQCNDSVTTCNTEIDIEIDLEKEKEKELIVIEKDNIQSEIERQFEEFWNLYPKKTTKKQAKVKFIVAVKEHGYKAIIDGVNKYIAEINFKKTAAMYIKNPATFLYNECYLEEFVTGVNNNGQPVRKSAEATELENYLGF